MKITEKDLYTLTNTLRAYVEEYGIENIIVFIPAFLCLAHPLPPSFAGVKIGFSIAPKFIIQARFNDCTVSYEYELKQDKEQIC